MFKQVKTHALALVPASFLVAGAANAAAVDVSDVVTDIAAQAAPIAAIAAALIVSVTVCISVVNIRSKDAVLEMVKAGADPIAAACAKASSVFSWRTASTSKR